MTSSPVSQSKSASAATTPTPCLLITKRIYPPWGPLVYYLDDDGLIGTLSFVSNAHLATPAPGSALATFQLAGNKHIFYIDSNGTVQELIQQSDSSWIQGTLAQRSDNAPAAKSSPLTGFAINNLAFLFYVSATGALRILVYDGNQWNFDVLTNPDSIAPGTGLASCATVGSDGAIAWHVFYVDTGRHVWELYGFGTSLVGNATNLSASTSAPKLAVASTSLASIATQDNQISVLYVAEDASICHFQGKAGDASSWGYLSATPAQSAFPQTDLSAFTVIGPDGQSVDLHVYFIGPDQHVYELLHRPSDSNPFWVSADITKECNGPNAMLNASLQGSATNVNAQTIYYCGAQDGELHALSWNSPDSPAVWSDTDQGFKLGFDLTGPYITVAPRRLPSYGTPSVYVLEVEQFTLSKVNISSGAGFVPAAPGSATLGLYTDIAHIFYIDSSGKVQELYLYGGTWTQGSPGNCPSAALAAISSPLAGFSTDASESHIYYVDTVGAIHELVWNGNTWQAYALPSTVLAAPGTGITAFATKSPQGSLWWHVYFVSTERHICELWFDGSTWTLGDLSTITGTPILAGASAQLAGFATGTNQQIVLYIAEDASVCQFQFNGDGVSLAWGHSVVTRAGSAFPQSDILAFESNAGNGSLAFQVYYTGADRHIYELLHSPANGGGTDGAFWERTDITGAGGAPNAVLGTSLLGGMTTMMSDGAEAMAPAVWYLAHDGYIHMLARICGEPLYWMDAAYVQADAPLESSAFRTLAKRLPPGGSLTVHYAEGEDVKSLSLSNGSGWTEASPGSAIFSLTTAGTPHIFYIDSSGMVQELYRPDADWIQGGAGNCSSGAPAAPMSPLSGLAIGACIYIYYVDAEGVIHELASNGSTWTSSALQTPGGVTPKTGLLAFSTTPNPGTVWRHVYYVNMDQHICELWFNGSDWTPGDLSVRANAPKLAEANSPLAGFATGPNRQIVFYVAEDRSVCQLQFNANGTSVAWEDAPITPPWLVFPQSDLEAFPTIGQDGVSPCLNVYYVGMDQHVHELFQSPSNSGPAKADQWLASDLTERSSGALAILGTALSGCALNVFQIAVYYHAEDGYLHELSWNTKGQQSWLDAARLRLDAPPVTVSVTPKLMENFHVTSPINPGSKTVAIGNAQGQVELVTVGDNNAITCFYPDPNSASGYSSTETGLSGSQVAAGRDANGRLVIFAASGSQLSYVIEVNDPSGRFSTPAQMQLNDAPEGCSFFSLAASNLGDELYLFAYATVSGSDEASTPSYYAGYTCWSKNPNALTSVPGMFRTQRYCVAWAGNTPETAVLLDVNLSSKRPVGVAYAGSSNINIGPTSLPYPIIDFAVTTDTNGTADQIVYLTKSGQTGITTNISKATSKQPARCTQIAHKQTARQIAVAKTASGHTHIFLVSNKNVLYHLQPTHGQANQKPYSNPANILDSVQQIAVATDTRGQIHIYATGSAHNVLTHLTLDEASSTWRISLVEVPSSAQGDFYKSYTNEITLADQGGAPYGNTAIEVWASDSMDVLINGASYAIGPTYSAPALTNAVGIVSVALRAKSLSCPTLFISVPSLMIEGEAVAVNPYTDVSGRLSTLTGPELIAAKDANGTPILGSNYRSKADDIANSINECFALGVNAVGASTSSRYLHPKKRRAGVGYFAGDKASLGQIHLPSVPKSSWRLSFGEDGPTFERLSAEQAGALVQERLASLRSASGIIQWLHHIGDLIRGIIDKIIDVIDVIVTRVEEGIQAAITFIVDGVKYIFNAIVKAVSEAIDLAQAIFAKIAITFEQLFQWLGFLFNWGDILRTHKAIAYVFNQGLDFLALSAVALKTQVDGAFDSFKDTLSSWFDIAQKQLGTAQSLGGFVQSNEQSNPELSKAMANNIVLTGFIDNASAIKSSPAAQARLLSTLDPKIDDLGTLLANLATNTQDAGQAFNNAIDTFKHLGGSREQIFHQILSGLLSVLQALLLVVIDGVQAIVDAVLDLAATLIQEIQTYLNEPWTIPIISELYSSITDGSTLTPIDLMALAAAIPVTIVYKVLNDAAPFPDDTSLKSFENVFTAQNILNATGLSSNAQGASDALILADGKWTGLLTPALAKLMTAFGTVSSIFGQSLATILDAKLILQIEGDPLNIGIASWCFRATSWFCGCPWSITSGRLTPCATGQTAARWLWIFDSFVLLIDLGLLPLSNKKVIDSQAQAIIFTIQGTARLGLSVPVWVKPFNPLAMVNLILGSLPKACKFLRLNPVLEATEGVSGGVLIAVDGIIAVAQPFVGLAANLKLISRQGG